jgi:hypothetical protein
MSSVAFAIPTPLSLIISSIFSSVCRNLMLISPNLLPGNAYLTELVIASFKTNASGMACDTLS